MLRVYRAVRARATGAAVRTDAIRDGPRAAGRYARVACMRVCVWGGGGEGLNGSVCVRAYFVAADDEAADAGDGGSSLYGDVEMLDEGGDAGGGGGGGDGGDGSGGGGGGAAGGEMEPADGASDGSGSADDDEEEEEESSDDGGGGPDEVTAPAEVDAKAALKAAFDAE